MSRRPTGFAEGQPGEVVTAAVLNPLEDRSSRGKSRPVILVRREGPNWLVMGLTTKPTYADGTPRTPIPNPDAVGLDEPGYLWADHLTRVCALDVHNHIGWTDDDLASVIIRQAGLGQSDAVRLHAATEWGWAS